MKLIVKINSLGVLIRISRGVYIHLLLCNLLSLSLLVIYGRLLLLIKSVDVGPRIHIFKIIYLKYQH